MFPSSLMYHFFLRKSFRKYVKYGYKKEIVRNNHIEVSNIAIVKYQY